MYTKIDTTIENNDHFSELCRKFDTKYGTSTYVTSMSLADIWNNFMIRNSPDQRYYADTITDYISEIINGSASSLFRHTTVVYSDDKDVSASDIGKMNSIYLMIQDINNGTPLKNPLSISAFPNGSFPIHPGGTRLMFSDVYHRKMPVMITDYTGNIIGKFSNIRFCDHSDIEFDFASTRLTHIEIRSDDKYCSVAYDKALNPSAYDEYGIPEDKPRIYETIHQIVDYEIQLDDYTYHKPKEVYPPRKFEYDRSSERIVVDDISILKKIQNRWVIDDTHIKGIK